MTFPQACVSCQNSTAQLLLPSPGVQRKQTTDMWIRLMSSCEHGQHVLPGRRLSLPKAAAVSTDLADLLWVWERQERNSITDKKDVQSAHTHKISEKKKTYCASFLNTEACQNTIRHSCSNMSVIDLCLTVNSACVYDNKKQLQPIMGLAVKIDSYFLL